MEDLFDTTAINVLDFDPRDSLSSNTTIIYDDVADARPNRVLDRSSSKDIYIKTPFSLNSETKVDQALLFKYVRALKPCDRIEELVNEYIAELPAPIENFIAVHIRHEKNFYVDVPRSAEPVLRNGAKSISRYRSLCNEASFSRAIRARMLYETHFLVASDSPNLVAEMRSNFGAASQNIHTLDFSLSVYCRSDVTRQLLCVRFALVELIALSRCGQGLLFSHWSSYSEILQAFFDESSISNGCFLAQHLSP